MTNLESKTIKELVEIYNDTVSKLDSTDKPTIKHFANKKVAIARVEEVLKELNEKSKFRPTKVSPPKPYRILACREGTKQALMVDELSREEGCTMDDLVNALKFGKTPWTVANIRSAFSWDMKQKGYGVTSFLGSDGVERFKLVLPEGEEFFVPPHRPLKKKPKWDARQAALSEGE